MLYILCAVFIILAGCANGIMDTLQFHYAKSKWARLNPLFWNPSISWKNKYKTDKEGNLLEPLRPKYPGSTTWLVWTTDAWHLFKFIYNGLIRLTIVLLAISHFELSVIKSIIFAVIMYIGLAFIKAIGFHITYKK